MIRDRAADPSREDIAIVGMACLFPGAETPGRFWQNIVCKVDCVTAPAPDWKAEWFLDATGKDPNRAYTGNGGHLGDLCRFDPLKYGVMPNSVEGSEPDHYVALRCAFEALADAGVPDVPFNRERTAVILGRGTYVNRGYIALLQHTYGIDQVINVLRQIEPHRSEADLSTLKDELRRNIPPFSPETIPGLAHCVMVGRIANRLGLHGPAYTVDAACTSSLIAVDQAMQELRSGRCDAALAGGVQVSTSAIIHILFCALQSLSRTGKIAPFSAQANGTLLGQGAGIVVLKRRSDAERDGNHIYALLKSIGISSDGKGGGLLAPVTEGQQLALRRAYEQADVSPSSIGLLEAHGTGIPLGDATEIRTLQACFAECPPETAIALGSVKSMISHLIPAAGIAALIKTALALHHRVLPPTLHAESPRSELGLEKTPFYIASETRPWIHGSRTTPRRAGINTFGFGGINAHAIVEEYTAAGDPFSFEQEWPVELIVVAAPDRKQLHRRLLDITSWLSHAESIRLLDAAATCAAQNGPCRVAVYAETIPQLVEKLERVASMLAEEARTRIQHRRGMFWYSEPLAAQGDVAFVFPGEGAQYVDMLSELCRHFPEVRRQFDLADEAFRRLGMDRGLSRSVFPLPTERVDSEEGLHEMATAVEAVTTADRGMLALLSRLGIEPRAVVGHSSGEFAALLAAGAIRIDTERELVDSIANGAKCTSRIINSQLVDTTVLTTVGGAGLDAVLHVVEKSAGRLSIALDNCPHQTVIAGNEQATEIAVKELKRKGALCQRLPWDRAYHTSGFVPACGILDEYYRTLPLAAPRLTVWSCATTQPYPTDPDEIRALAVRQWRSPVRFRETIEQMYDSGVRIFVEVGPRGNLCAFIDDILSGRSHVAIPVDLMRKGGTEQLCRALAMLAAHGVPMKLDALFSRRRPRVLDFAATPSKAAPRAPVLRLDLPELTVGEQVKAALQTEGSIPKPEPDVPTAEGIAVPGMKEVSTSIAPDSTGRVARPAAIDDRNGSSRARVFADFQETMRAFLRLQQRVMTGFPSDDRPNPNPGRTTPVAWQPQDAPPQPSPNTRCAPNTHCAPNNGTAQMSQAPARQAADVADRPDHSSARSPEPGSGAAAIGTAVRAAPLPVAPEVSWEDRLRHLTSDRTGYPADMLDLDAELEAELGIDSIKRVEIIGAFRRDVLGDSDEAPAGLMDRVAGAKSLRHVLEAMRDFLDSDNESAPKREGSESCGPRSSAPQFPFTEHVRVFEPKRRLVFECDLDIDKHLFLRDHTFGRTVSLRDPSLTALPVMPLAMTMELMAEAASMLVPDRKVSALSDVKTFHWLPFPTPRRRVRVEATATKEGGVAAAVFEADREEDSKKIAESRVELAASPPSLGTPVLEVDPKNRSRWRSDELYERGLFHGPAFRSIQSIDGVDRGAIRASVRQPDPGLLLADGAGHHLVLPVSLTDGAGQILGFWGAEDGWTMGFPTGVERLELSSSPRSDVSLTAVASVQQPETAVWLSDVELCTPTGEVVLRVLGRRDRILAVPDQFWEYRIAPETVVLCRDLSKLFEGVPGAEQCTVCVLNDWSGDCLCDDSGFWRLVLAHLVLTGRERQEWAHRNQPTSAAVSWLLGRIVAKDAVRLRLSVNACMADVDIQSDANGRPRVEPWLGNSLRLSIAHKGFEAAAVVVDQPGCRGIGIDLEPIRPLDSAVIEDGFDHHERVLIEQAARDGSESIDFWWVAGWCAKEAIGKAFGCGLAGNPRNIHLVEVDAKALVLSATVAGAVPEDDNLESPPTGLIRSDASVRIWNNQVLALCIAFSY